MVAADKYPKLTWDQRYNIILGICRGLQYLHDECPDGVRIVHMDLKADNVLVQIDANGALIPKIGDFGISWPLNMDKPDDYTNNPLGNM
jgi:coatomer subunit beta'